MTAVVGILNKQGIALAADSAITVGSYGNRKVYNYANKIFMLSKKNPVGIAIYNNASLMGIPWEILIKEYRKHLHINGYETLSMYKSDFFVWLAEHNFFGFFLVMESLKYFHVYCRLTYLLLLTIKSEWLMIRLRPLV